MGKRLILVVGVLTGVAGLGAPATWAHSEQAAVCVKTYAPIVVDGKLSDWTRRVENSNWSAQLEIKQGNALDWMRAVPIHVNTLTSRVEAGAITGPGDLSAVIYTMWDEQNFYLAAVVNDDQVVTQHQGADIWQDDALEIWFDCRHDAVTHTLFQDDEYQLGFSPGSQYRAQALAWVWRNPEPEPVIAAVKVASVATPTGYVLEASVPWKVLHGASPAIGGLMGFNISIVDKDEDQQWTHLTWSGKLHSDPTQFGHLYFMDAPVDLLPADVLEAPPPPEAGEFGMAPTAVAASAPKTLTPKPSASAPPMPKKAAPATPRKTAPRKKASP